MVQERRLAPVASGYVFSLRGSTLTKGEPVATETRRETWLHKQLGKPQRLGFLILVAVLFALGACLGLGWAAGFGRIADELIHPNWFWLALALSAEACAYLGYTLAYREIVRAEGGAELEVPKSAALVATGFGVFLQGGGFALDRAALERAGLSQREARGRVLGLSMLEYLILAPATAAAALVILLRHEAVRQSLTLPWVIGVPVGGALALGALVFRDRFEGKRCWRRHIGDALRGLRLALSLPQRPHKYGLGVLGMGVYWVGDIACLWATLHVFSAQPPPLAPLIVAYATGYALTRRALPLGGAGIVEVFLVFALGWVGIPLAKALLAVVLYRAINLWLPMIPALAGIPTLRVMEQRRPRRGAARAR